MIPLDAEYGSSTKILHLLIACDRFQTPFAFSFLSQVIRPNPKIPCCILVEDVARPVEDLSTLSASHESRCVLRLLCGFRTSRLSNGVRLRLSLRTIALGNGLLLSELMSHVTILTILWFRSLLQLHLLMWWLRAGCSKPLHLITRSYVLGLIRIH